MFDHHHTHHHYHHHYDGPGKSEVQALTVALTDLITQGFKTMAKTLQDIIDQGKATLDQVTKNTDLDNSIIAIVKANAQTITDLRAQLAAAGTDPAKLAELGDVMDQLAAKATAEGQATADAVTANTPAA